MMTEAGFLRAMQDEDDDTSRLVCADWLEEHGGPASAARAEFIRVQCELARWVPDLRRRQQLQQREQELLAEYAHAWLGPLHEHCLSCRFERGLARVTMDATHFVSRPFAAQASELLRRARVAAVRLEDAVNATFTLAGADHLDEVTELDLSGQRLVADFIVELMKSRSLGRLRRLDLSNNQLGEPALWLLARSPHLPRLRRLLLRNNQIRIDDRWGEDFSTGDPGLACVDLHGNLLSATAHRAVARRQNGMVWNDGGYPPRLFNSLGMQLALIPPGTFLMGAAADESGHFPNETPQHEITLTRPFYLGLYPVTQRDYRTVMGANPSHFTGRNGGAPNHPVEQVTWDDAVAFCERLSALPEEEKAGRTYRLPTEAEWEHACRAGTTTPFHFGTIACSTQANFSGRHPYGGAPEGPYLQGTSAVGNYPPNAFGLYDLHGNVWEWCHDWYQADYYGGSPAADPPGPPSGDGHPLRGGSWYIVGRGCRSAERCHTDEAPVRRAGSIGFRVAMTPRP